jgi:hypothetical protein
MPYENRFIWGATAGMLRNLYHLLKVWLSFLFSSPSLLSNIAQ